MCQLRQGVGRCGFVVEELPRRPASGPARPEGGLSRTAGSRGDGAGDRSSGAPRAAGLPPSTCCQTFRATGITGVPVERGTPEHAQQVAGRAYPNVTKLLRPGGGHGDGRGVAALNAAIIRELEAGLPTRHLDDGRPVEEALAQERRHLRAMPAHLPATCRVVPRFADKFGHVRVDKVTYSVAIRHAYGPVWVKLYDDHVAVAGRRRGGRRASPRVLPGREGPRCASRAAAAGAEAPGRGRGDGACRLAAGSGVAAGAGRARQAHAQARPGMGPDAANAR